MLVSSDAIGLSPEESPARLVRRVELYIGEALEAVGDLTITTRRVIFDPTPAPDGSAAKGVGSFSLYYQAIVMHAVSRDTASFHSPCIYLQLDEGHTIASTTANRSDGAKPKAAEDGGAPMDVEGGEEASEEDEEDEDEAAQELRLVPIAYAEAGDATLDAALDRLFEALSECAALNPDPDDSGDDDGDDGFFFDGEGGGGEDASLIEGATPAQMAMLARYDAMLEASAAQSGAADDGRFDDPDDDAKPQK